MYIVYSKSEGEQSSILIPMIITQSLYFGLLTNLFNLPSWLFAVAYVVEHIVGFAHIWTHETQGNRLAPICAIFNIAYYFFRDVENVMLCIIGLCLFLIRTLFIFAINYRMYRLAQKEIMRDSEWALVKYNAKGDISKKLFSMFPASASTEFCLSLISEKYDEISELTPQTLADNVESFTTELSQLNNAQNELKKLLVELCKLIMQIDSESKNDKFINACKFLAKINSEEEYIITLNSIMEKQASVKKELEILLEEIQLKELNELLSRLLDGKKIEQIKETAESHKALHKLLEGATNKAPTGDDSDDEELMQRHECALNGMFSQIELLEPALFSYEVMGEITRYLKKSETLEQVKAKFNEDEIFKALYSLEKIALIDSSLLLKKKRLTGYVAELKLKRKMKPRYYKNYYIALFETITLYN